MKSDLKIYTSYISAENIERIIKKNYLPLFPIRSIYSSPIIGQYSGTAIHLKELSPSVDLFRSWRGGQTSTENYKKLYALEILKNVSLEDEIKKLEFLAETANAEGVVLLGYSTDSEECHRKIISGLFWGTGTLVNKPEELVW